MRRGEQPSRERAGWGTRAPTRARSNQQTQHSRHEKDKVEARWFVQASKRVLRGLTETDLERALLGPASFGSSGVRCRTLNMAAQAVQCAGLDRTGTGGVLHAAPL